MLKSRSIIQLYENVMFHDMEQYGVPEEAIRISIESMAQVYSSDTLSLSSNRSIVADYNDVAHRCAYLHKYAAFHTAMVQDIFEEALKEYYVYFRQWVISENEFNICSLGGGPGNDVIATVSALHSAFSFFPVSATVVDYMSNWSYSFDSILRELGSGLYGEFGRYMSFSMPSRYLAANLLKTPTPEVLYALSNASLITMVKFASATACQDTDFMLKNVFAAMKPGAMVLYIDNDGGGYNKIFEDAAIREGFTSEYGPVKHLSYTNEHMKLKKFGYASCFQTTITVHIVRKPPYYGPCFPNQYQSYNSYIASPLTPLTFNPMDSLLETPETPANYDFSRNADLQWQGFRSASTTEGDARATPVVKKAKRKNQKLRNLAKNFRHHVGRKVNELKARARKVIRRKKKPNHPIFTL